MHIFETSEENMRKKLNNCKEHVFLLIKDIEYGKKLGVKNVCIRNTYKMKRGTLK